MTAAKGHGPPPATDFEGAFRNGRRFEEDGWQYELEVVPIAELCLPTGKIVAADPGDLDGRVKAYFRRVVPPGRYPVDLSIRHARELDGPGRRDDTAYIRVRFKDAPVAVWEMATVGDEDLAKLGPFEVFSYSVDVGMGSFADSSGLVKILREYEERGETLSDEFYFERVLPAYEAAKGLSADIPLDPSTGANLVVCSSGVGDGNYASFWGLSDDGEPVCLVTDFNLLLREVRTTRELGRLADLLGHESRFDLPAGEVVLRFRMPDKRTLLIEASGAGAPSATLRLREKSKRGQPRESISPLGYGTLRDRKPIAVWGCVLISYLERLEPL